LSIGYTCNGNDEQKSQSLCRRSFRADKSGSPPCRERLFVSPHNGSLAELPRVWNNFFAAI